MSTQAGDLRAEAPAPGRRPLRALVATLVAAGLLFTLANPVGTYLDQRRELQAAEERAEVLAARSAELEARAARLRTDAEVERIAREQHGLVLPGEEAFGILPAPAPPPPPPAPPRRRSWAARAWDAATFWD